jgi:hypothetical protein
LRTFRQEWSCRAIALSPDARIPDFAVDLVRVVKLLLRPALSAVRIEVPGEQD